MEAPLVSLEEEFEEGPAGEGGSPDRSLEEEFEEGPAGEGGSPQRPADPALAELESFSAEMMSFKSMEDLVQEFDEKLTVCFRNYDAATEGLAPVRGRLQAQEEEERLQDEEPAVPLPSLCLLQLGGKEEEEEEEEELTERSEQDSGINEEPLLTAEQVIEELEELMQSSPDPEEEEDEEEEEESKADAEGKVSLSALCMSGSSLIALGTSFMALSRSEILVAQLARRDELAFEKEVKTAFIGALLAVQGEQREQREAARRRRRDKGLSLQGTKGSEGNVGQGDEGSMEGISSILHSGLRQTFGPTTNEKQYLNTVIPYEKKGSPPSVEDLQMLTNSEYSFKLLVWVSITCFRDTKAHFALLQWLQFGVALQHNQFGGLFASSQHGQFEVLPPMLHHLQQPHLVGKIPGFYHCSTAGWQPAPPPSSF
uniref:Fasciculation and elongation protein zeta 1 n=1 Tax=Ficedula albicollis TaxID=59894 RepID=U3JS94_FICAL